MKPTVGGRVLHRFHILLCASILFGIACEAEAPRKQRVVNLVEPTPAIGAEHAKTETASDEGETELTGTPARQGSSSTPSQIVVGGADGVTMRGRGRIDVQVLLSEINAAGDRLTRCFVGVSPDSAQITVQLKLLTSGRIAFVKLRSETPLAPKAKGCVIDVLKSLRLGKAHGGTAYINVALLIQQ